MAVKESLVVVETGSRSVSTKRGPSATYSFKGSNGQWYQCGFSKPPCDKGDKIEFFYTDNTYGHQVDMKSIMVVGKANLDPEPAVASVPKNFSGGGRAPSVFPIPALDGQRAIVRQNALTNAREMIADHGDFVSFGTKHPTTSDIVYDMDKLANEIIRIARKFEAYSCGDLDVEEVMAEKQAEAKE